MTDKLKPCPFCGADREYIVAEEYEHGAGKRWRVFCLSCMATMDKGYCQTQWQALEAWNRRAEPEITGETSDGYHTFNELYHHRAVLFSVICNDRPALAWKSKLHHDGTMYDGMFIVGIETPDGQATYHYDIEPYWEMFNVQELPQAPEWDGHTPAQAIERIGKLNPQPENKPLTLEELRQMDGEPVWIKHRANVKFGEPWQVVSEWMIVDAKVERLLGLKRNVPFGHLNQSEALAYRTKPERSDG